VTVFPSARSGAVYTEPDLDEALLVARQQANAAEDETYAAGILDGAELMHRYLIERDRLTDTDIHE